jgi:hypothetical protein
MKTHFIAIGLLLLPCLALAQGKVTLGNDSNHYIVIGKALPADAAYGGGVASTNGNSPTGTVGAIPVSPLPSGKTLVAALYAGTTASNLVLETSVILDSHGWRGPGLMRDQKIALVGIQGGLPAFFRVDVFDVAYPDAETARAAGSYAGTSGVFTMNPGPSILFPSIVADPSSTWASGNLVVNAIDPTLPDTTTLAVQPTSTNTLVVTWLNRWKSDELWVQEATNPVSGPWTTLTNRPANAGAQLQLQLPQPSTARFYRLAY